MDTRTRKIAITGVMGAISILLGATHWGFIPWFSWAGAALTVMHVPVIIGAILEGPLVGAGLGLIFGLFSLLQAAIAPTGPADVWFVNPLVSILPRLFIGPLAWLVYRGLARFNEIVALIQAGIVGSLTNTVLVLGMIGLLKHLPWVAVPPVPSVIFIALVNGVPEAIAAALVTLFVIAAWKRIELGRRKGASI